MSGWLGVAQLGLQVADSWMSSSAAHNANRTNIRLQREQQAWEKEMSNTAVQRHAADIEAAGGNRALAFVNGQQASTPSIAPARVESTYQGGTAARAIQGAAALAQVENTKANTAQQLAQARITNVEADIREGIKGPETHARLNHFVEQYDQDDLRTQILRAQKFTSAAEAERATKTIDAMVQMVHQQARAGKLDLDALENVAKMGGLEATKASSIIKLLLDLIRTSK